MKRKRTIVAAHTIEGTSPANERIIMLLLSNHHSSAPLARIQNAGMLGLSEYDRLVRNVEVENCRKLRRQS